LKIEDREQNGFVGFLTKYSIRFTTSRVTTPTIALVLLGHKKNILV